MLTKKITDGIYYVGANDRTTTRFEGLWPLPYGVSYNSYLVAGNDKTAIIDGVEISHAFEQIAQIKKILHDNAPDYLIVNHMEPDHTGAVQCSLASPSVASEPSTEASSMKRWTLLYISPK